jgi:hypothetical protein
MKRINIVAVIVLLSCALVITNVMGQESQIHLQVIPERTIVFPAEPLRVRLILTNHSKETIEIYPFLPSTKSAILVKPPGDNWRYFVPFMGISCVPYFFYALAPGESKVHDLRLDIESGGKFLLTEPGDWLFMFNWSIRRPKGVISSSITIKVLQAPPDEIMALKEFLNIPNISVIMHYLNSDAFGEEAQKMLKEFNEKYENSLYSNYALFCIAKSMIPIVPFKKTRLPQHDPARALPIFLRLSNLSPNEFSLSGDALFYAAVCYYQIGDIKNSVTLLKSFVDKFPNAHLIIEAKNYYTNSIKTRLMRSLITALSLIIRLTHRRRMR